MNKGDGDFIMSAEALRAFESQLEELGLSDGSASQRSTAVESATVQNGQPSLSEERAWMLHQQDPLAASGPFIVSLRLSGEIDPTRLIEAIKHLYRGDSNLNLVYRLNSEGELEKVHQPTDNPPVEQVAVHSDREAIQYLLRKLDQPMDLATDPAIRFMVMPRHANEVILGILGHHVLLDDSAWKPVLTALSRFYEQRESACPAVERALRPVALNASDQSAAYWQNLYPSGLQRTRLPDLFKASQQVDVSVQEYGKAVLFEQSSRVVRFHTATEYANILHLSEASQASVFQTLLYLFGVYIDGLLDLPSVDILVPLVSHREVDRLSEIESSSNVIAVRITNDQEDTRKAIIEVRNRILEGMENNLPIEQVLSVTRTKRSSVPNILFTQFVDLSQYIKIPGISVEMLNTPPLRSDYDITLAFQIDQENNLKLELTTGVELSRTIGAFLLEQFVIFLRSVSVESLLIPPRLIDISNAGQATERVIEAAAVQERLPTKEKQRIAQIILDEFKAVLALPNLTVHDHFFDQGGHSLLATRVIGKLQTRHGLIVKISDFFNSPTAAELAEYIEYAEERQHISLSAAPDQNIIAPLSLLQQTYLEFSDFGRNPIFNIPYALRFSEPVDEQAFRLAFLDIFERHHALRTVYVSDKANGAFQQVVPMSELSEYAWFWSSDEQGRESCLEVLRQEAMHSFDLTQRLPIRVKFLSDDEGRQVLSLLIYHSAMDEWSTAILVNELFQAYVSRSNGLKPQWGNTPRQFHQYAVEQDHARILGEHLDYWVATLGKVGKSRPLFQAAHDRQSNHDIDFTGAFISFALDAGIATSLNSLAKASKASLFHVIYSAIALSMYVLGAGKRILIGTSVSGREDPAYQDTIGYFTNVVMHHTSFAESQSVKALIQQVRDNIIDGLPYSDVPFGIIEESVRAEDETSPDSLFEIYIQFHAKNILTGSFIQKDGRTVYFELLEPERATSKFGLHFEVYEEPLSITEAIRVVITYRLSHYSDQQIELIKDTTEKVLRIMAELEDLQDIDLMDVRRRLSILSH